MLPTPKQSSLTLVQTASSLINALYETTAQLDFRDENIENSLRICSILLNQTEILIVRHLQAGDRSACI
jgi:hypothetical protein